MNSRIDYEIIYKKKKTISISIDLKGKVKVSAPIGTSKKVIEEIIRSKKKWILNKLNEINSREVLETNTIMYLGRKYSLEIIVQPFLKRNFITIFENKFLINVSSKDMVMKTIDNYLKKEIFNIVQNKINKYKDLFDSYPKDIKIKTLKSRWGSCSYDNVLTFNSKLVMFREEAIEYVVVHELCHMIYKNHSKEYWDLVCEIMPNYKIEHKYLQENSHLVNLNIVF